MFGKNLKYFLAIVVILLIAYNSVYFKKLDEVKQANTSREFNPVSYARDYLDKKLPAAIHNAVEISTLTRLLQTRKEETFKKYSHALGIGNLRYFLVKGEGVITRIDDDFVSVHLKDDTAAQTIQVATEYVFGNAVRDASGLININEFTNTMDFNNVSAEINKIIRKEVLPPFKAQAKEGAVVQFAGAIELNAVHLKLDNIEVIPITLKLSN